MDAMGATHLGRTIGLTELAVDLTTLQNGAPPPLAQAFWSYASAALAQAGVFGAIEEARGSWPGAPPPPRAATELWSFASAARAWASSNLVPTSVVARSLRVGLAVGSTQRAAHLLLAAPDPAHRAALRLDPWETARGALGDARTNLGWALASGPLPEPLASLAARVRAVCEHLGPVVEHPTGREMAARALHDLGGTIADPWLWGALAALPSDGGPYAGLASVPVQQSMGPASVGPASAPGSIPFAPASFAPASAVVAVAPVAAAPAPVAAVPAPVAAAPAPVAAVPAPVAPAPEAPAPELVRPALPVHWNPPPAEAPPSSLPEAPAHPAAAAPALPLPPFPVHQHFLLEPPPPLPEVPAPTAAAPAPAPAPAGRRAPEGAAKVHAVLERFSRKEADVDDAVRALIAHDDWIAPVALVVDPKKPGQVHHRMLILGSGSGDMAPGGELWVFTDDASAARASMERTDMQPHVGGLTGLELFAAVARHPSIRKLRVNPRSPVERTFFAEDAGLGVFQSRRGALAFEALLAKPGPRDDTFWEGFLDADGFGVFAYENGAYVTMTSGVAPLTNPIAVFSAPDCARDFLAALPGAVAASLKRIIADPAKLLDMLAGSADFDGAVFNPMGPGPKVLLDRAALLALHTPSAPKAAGPGAPAAAAGVAPAAPFPAPLPSPATMFVAGQLRHLVALHFDRLDLLTAAGRGAEGALAARLKERMDELPRLGPIVVSSVYEVEGIMAQLGAEPPPPPRDGASLATWAKQVAATVTNAFEPARWAPFHGDPRVGPAVAAEGRAVMAYALGREIGDLQHTLDLLATVDDLRTRAPVGSFLDEQRNALEASRAKGVAALRDRAVDAVTLARLGSMWVRWLLAALEDADPVVAEARDRASPHPGPRAGWSAHAALASVGAIARALPRMIGLDPARVRAAFVNLSPGRPSPRDEAVFAEILAYPAWWQPLQLPSGGRPGAILSGGGSAFTTPTPAGPRALAFSGDDEIAEHPLPPVPWWPAQGGEIVARLPREVAALGFEPSAAHGVTLADEQLARLRAAAEGFAIEAAIADWARVDAARLVRFDGWIVAPGVTTADAAGRRFQVAFTRRAHAEAFAEREGAPPGGWSTMTGKALFERCLGEVPPGLWINPGPGSGAFVTRRFNAGFLKVALG